MQTSSTSAARIAAAARLAGLVAVSLGCSSAEQQPKQPETSAPAASTSAQSAPDPDPDRDGITTADDRCPHDPEDCDSLVDDDGCPEEDADRDGAKDACDHCPMQPGINRPDHPHGRGCPYIDAFVDSGEFLRGKAVLFARDSAKLPPRAPEALGPVASEMTKQPAHLRFFVIGHATPEERDPEALSERRAAEVVTALVALGVDRARLEPHGAGASHPVFSGEPRAADATKSRRVELDVDYNHARPRHWSAERKQVEAVVPKDLPCDAAPAITPGPCQRQTRQTRQAR